MTDPFLTLGLGMLLILFFNSVFELPRSSGLFSGVLQGPSVSTQCKSGSDFAIASP